MLKNNWKKSAYHLDRLKTGLCVYKKLKDSHNNKSESLLSMRKKMKLLWHFTNLTTDFIDKNLHQ